MKFSVVLATMNRKELLKKAIDSVLMQTFPDFEIIVVDQSDQENMRIQNDPRITYMHIREKGLSHARNIGLEMATGEIVGLLDDDAEYLPDTLDRANEIFVSNTLITILSGRTVDPLTNKPLLNGMPQKSGCVNSWNVLKRSISTSLFIKKSFLETEKFDERFGVGSEWGSAEETDIVLRCIGRHKVVYYSPDVITIHPSVSKKDISFEKLKAYSIGFGALAQKHKGEYHNYLFYMRCRVVMIKQIIGMIISLVKGDIYMVEYYWLSYRYKRYGIRRYKREK